MPIKPLPRSLIRRLRRAYKAKGKKEGNPRQARAREPKDPIDREQWDNPGRLLVRLKNVDPRRKALSEQKPELAEPGFRLRKLSVKRNYPEVREVVIKNLHGDYAEHTIQILRRTVKEHNKRFPNANYKLLAPIAYPIGEGLVAMSRIKYPSVIEVIGWARHPLGESWARKDKKEPLTKRGKAFFNRLKRENPGNPNCSLKALIREMNHVWYRTEMSGHVIGRGNLFLAGFENGKFVFLPAVDLR